MTDETLPKNMDGLLAEIDRQWSALMEVVGRLTAGQMNTPDSGGWSPKDNLAHLAHWERYMHLHYLDGRPVPEAMGFDADTLAGLDEDGINARIFKRNRDRSSSDVLEELKQVHAGTVKALARLPFSRLMQPNLEDDLGHRPILVWVIGNTSEHFEEHRRNMEKAAGI